MTIRILNLLLKLHPYIVFILHIVAICFILQLPKKQGRKTDVSEFNLRCNIGESLYKRELGVQYAMDILDFLNNSNGIGEITEKIDNINEISGNDGVRVNMVHGVGCGELENIETNFNHPRDNNLIFNNSQDNFLIQKLMNKLQYQLGIDTFFIGSNSQKKSFIALINPPRIDGREVILVTVKWSQKKTVAFAISFLKILSQAKWLSKNFGILFEVEDGHVDEFLTKYALQSDTSIRYMGRIFSAFALDDIGDSMQSLNRLILLIEPYGTMPNLDLIAAISQSTLEMNGRVGLDPLASHESAYSNFLSFFHHLWYSTYSAPKSHAAYMSFYGWNAVGITTNYQNDPLKVLLSPYSLESKKGLISNYQNVKTIAIGSLNKFGTYVQNIIPDDMKRSLNQVGSIIFENLKYFDYGSNDSKKYEFQLSYSDENFPQEAVHFYVVGNILENVIHHLQNADELLHQSVYEYFLTSANEFIDTEHIPSILILTAAILFRGILFLSIDNIKDGCILEIPQFFAKIASCSIVHLFPKFIKHYFIWKYGLIPTYRQIEQIETCYLCAALIASILLALISYNLVFSPLAEEIKWTISRVVLKRYYIQSQTQIQDQEINQQNNFKHNLDQIYDEKNQNRLSRTIIASFFYLSLMSYYCIQRNSIFIYFIFCVPLLNLRWYNSRYANWLHGILRFFFAQPFVLSSIILAMLSYGIFETIANIIVHAICFDSMLWNTITMVQIPLLLFQM